MVSIHRIPIVLYLTIRVLCFAFRFKRGTVCSILKSKALGKPEKDKI